MNNMHSVISKQSKWYQEPIVWLILGLLISAVTLAFIMLAIAIQNADTVVDDSRWKKEGLSIVSIKESKQQQWTATTNNTLK